METRLESLWVIRSARAKCLNFSFEVCDVLLRLGQFTFKFFYDLILGSDEVCQLFRVFVRLFALGLDLFVLLSLVPEGQRDPLVVFFERIIVEPLELFQLVGFFNFGGALR